MPSIEQIALVLGLLSIAGMIVETAIALIRKRREPNHPAIQFRPRRNHTH